MATRKIPAKPVNTTVPDIINRPIAVGDYVVYHTRVYQVQKLAYADTKAIQSVVMMLLSKTKSTRAKEAYSKHCCKIPKEDMMMWALGKDYSEVV